MGRGGCNGREGRRPRRLLGHACVAILLLSNAVATSTSPSTCTATVSVITPRSGGLVLEHHHHQLPSISRHSLRLPRSCLRPSRSAAAPELPVLEVAGQHRICTVVTPTSMPGQREDVQTGASSHVNSPPEQRVKLIYEQLSREPIRTFRHCGIFVVLPARYAASTHQLPLFARDVARVSAVDSPRLKRPPLALDARDTDEWCYITSLFLLRCTYAERATRVGQGQGVVGPTSATPVHSAREGSLPFGGQVTTKADASRRTLKSHARSAPPHCTTTTATSATTGRATLLLCPGSDWSAALVSAATEGWRGYLPPQALRLGRHYQFSLLHCTHHFCTGCRQRLGSWVPTTASKYSTLGTLHTTPRPSCGGFTALHKRTTATPKHGSTSGSPHCCCRITSG